MRLPLFVLSLVAFGSLAVASEIGSKVYPLQDSAVASAVHGKPCTNFSGQWDGKCNPSGMSPYDNSLNIRQVGCGEIELEKRSFKIYESQAQVPHLKNQNDLTLYWNEDSSALNIIMPYQKHLEMKIRDGNLLTEISWENGKSSCVQLKKSL